MKKIISSSCFLFLAGLGSALADSESSPFGVDAKYKNDGTPFVASLAGRWRFQTDPENAGLDQGWQTGSWDDSAWPWIESGKSWQSQGWNYGGYAWYRAEVFIPKECEGRPVDFDLGNIRDDDEVFLNGRKIGGIRGAYKYENLQNRRYPALPSEIRYGELNSIAIRVWGTREGAFVSESGLLEKSPRMVVDSRRLWALPEGGNAGEEVPIERFDLSKAQAAMPFGLIVSPPRQPERGAVATLEWMLEDVVEDHSARAANPSFDFQLFPPGPTPAPWASGKAHDLGEGRWRLSVDAETARKIYLNGRLQVEVVGRDADGREVYRDRLVSKRLDFSGRDRLALPRLEAPPVHQTPFGRLTLIDEIDAAAPLDQEAHPYIQGGFEEPRFRQTPGAPVGVEVNEVLGRKARESGLGWFAYRIGRGKLVTGQAYLLRIEYPEDKPRYFPIHLETGLEYSGIGWTSGVSPENPYNNWPLSGTWRWHDAVVVAGTRTLGSGGAENASGEHGFWVYFLNKVKPDKYYAMYEGGPVVARIRLYALDADKDAPRITLPDGLPKRTLMFDWERQPLQAPDHIVRYARLMGYNAISPLLLKWGFTSFGEDMAGYDSAGVDTGEYYIKSGYQAGSGQAPAPVVAGKPSVHRQYLDATRGSGIQYFPRIEYGGSMDLPEAAWAKAPGGKPMKTSRYIPWGANLLAPATWEDLRMYLEAQIKPFVANNPQLGGILWRIRCDRMLPSYAEADLALFAKEMETALPPGTPAEQGLWAQSGDGAADYHAWWLKKRADFHYQIRDLLKGYRPDMEFLYYNWDWDKWSLGLPDMHAGAFYRGLLESGKSGNEYYAGDAAARRQISGADYVEMLRTGQLFPAPPVMNLDRALDMSFYRDAGSMKPFGPVNYLYFADKPDYLNYFQTNAGLAISHAVAFDELGYKSVNPKYECNMPVPGGGNFSMALELLSWFHGDVATLTWTTYTYGRSFAAEHRRFAQAFLALPAIPGKVIDQNDPDVKVRLYPSDKRTYLGVAFKGYEGKKLAIRIPGRAGAKLKNLATNDLVKTMDSGGDLRFAIESGPMELHAFRLE